MMGANLAFKCVLVVLIILIIFICACCAHNFDNSFNYKMPATKRRRSSGYNYSKSLLAPYIRQAEATYGRAKRDAERTLLLKELDSARTNIPLYRSAYNDKIGNYRKWMGRGAYSLGKQYRKIAQSKFGRKVRGIGEGAALGFLAGGPAGAAVGGEIGGMGLYTGRGTYNSLISGGDASMGFMGSFDETEGMTITDTEYISDIYGAPDAKFQTLSYQLNPGLQQIFPKLSQFAANFEEYEWVQLIFSFKSTIDATTASTGNTGSILMATNYNPSALPYTDKEAVLQSHGGNSGRLTEDLVHGIECDPDKSVGDMEKYVRTSPVIAGEDIKTYDHGLFQIALNNTPTDFRNKQVGELWCSYTVRLRKPRLFAARGNGIQKDLFVSNTGETALLPLGTNSLMLRGQQNSIGCQITQSGANAVKITFPASVCGLFNIVLRLDGASATSTFTIGALGYTLTGNCELVNNQYATGSNASDTPGSYVGPLATAAAVGQVTFGFSVYCKSATDGINNSIEMLNLISATSGITQSMLTITEDNPQFFTTGLTNPAPVLVNSANVVVVP